MSDETTTATEGPGEFTLTLIDESKPTIDGRIFEPGVVEWREPPVPLMFMTENGANGHKGSKVGGAITKVWREGDQVLGQGVFANTPEGQELRALIADKILTGVSSDVGGAIVEQELADDGKTSQARIIKGRIMGATVLPFQAFDDTRIAVTASAVPQAAPREWFNNPKLKGPTPLTITTDGQVFGHAALWDTCHIGKPGTCLTPPHSKSNYSYFNRGVTLTAEGDEVHTGPITLGTGHANVTLNSNAAAEHYDNTGTAIADVVAGEDAYGIWMAGAVRPTATEDRLHELRAATISGDWRGIQGNHELVALLAVNTPGFPVPRTRATFAEEKPLALVAAGVVETEEHPVDEETTATETLTAETESVVADGTIELTDETRPTDSPVDETAETPTDAVELTDEERAELEARIVELEVAVLALAAPALELNVGSGKKCSNCGGTVAAGRSTCHNCGGSV